MVRVGANTRLRLKTPSGWLTACLAVVTLLFAVGEAAIAADRSSDQRFLAGLRQRRLFLLAESYCTGRLAEQDLPHSRRAELVIELSLTLSERAVNSAPSQREPLWQRARQVTEDFTRQHPQSPRLMLVRFQGALVPLIRGELTRQESQVAASGSQPVDDARSSLSTAIRLLKELQEDAEQELRRRNVPTRAEPAGDDPDQLTIHALSTLLDNVRYQLARAYRNQGQCYADDSPDWSNSLSLAAEMLGQLAKHDTSDPLAWKSRLEELVCYRLLADYPTAGAKLDAVTAEKPPPEIALRARAEQLHLALAIGDVPRAIGLLSAGRELDGVTSSELDFAILKTYLAAWQGASESNDNQKASQWQTKADEMVRLIQNRHGPYWTRRAQMLLSGYVRTLPGGDLNVWTQAAEDAYHGKRYDDALTAYDRARGLAQQQGDLDQAFKLAKAAADVERLRGRHQEAINRYRQLATATPGDPRAANAHLFAAYHAGQAAKSGTAGCLDQYVGLLMEHLEIWPAGETVDEVRWSLGRLREYQRDWPAAIEQYQAVSPDFRQYSEAVEAAIRCYPAYLDQCQAASQGAEQIAVSAADWLESLIFNPQQQLPQHWSPPARAAAVAAARIRLNYTKDGFGRAEFILTAALDAAVDAPDEWKSAARTLLVFSLAGQGLPDEAANVLRRISAAKPDDLLDMLKGISRIAADADPQVRSGLAKLALDAVDLARAGRSELSQSKQRDLRLIEARALADSGRVDDALKAYLQLAKAYPDDGQVQEAYASRLLAAGTDRSSQEAALAKWRELEKRSRPGTERWFRAKLSIALLHHLMGNDQQAERIINLVQLLHPEPKLGDREVTNEFLEMLDPETRSRFLDLLNRCGA